MDFRLTSYQIQNFDGYAVTSGLEYTMSEKHSLSFAGTVILNANANDLISTTNFFFVRNRVID
jgi:hypothetical protein